jgi:hypothetical protein
MLPSRGGPDVDGVAGIAARRPQARHREPTPESFPRRHLPGNTQRSRRLLTLTRRSAPASWLAAKLGHGVAPRLLGYP